jgi:hypothetical protein
VNPAISLSCSPAKQFRLLIQAQVVVDPVLPQQHLPLPNSIQKKSPQSDHCGDFSVALLSACSFKLAA